MKKYKISIITVVYNNANTIEQTILSVIKQTYRNIEYIIIDGQSTDGTLDVIKKYSSCVNIFISEPDNGIYEAMNKGVSLATGDYIEIIGADDCFCSCETIEKIVQELNDDVDILSCCQWAVIDNHWQRLQSNINARDKCSYKGGMIPHASMFVKKKIMDRYPFDVKYRIAADYKFFLKCYFDETIKFKFLDMKAVYFSANGISSNVNACMIENKKIYKELNLNIVDDSSGCGFKSIIKSILVEMGIMGYVNHLRYSKHRCDNEYCRWCGRI